MKWYRRMYFKTFEWYRDMNGPQSWPESYAAGILGMLHGLNVVALAMFCDVPLSDRKVPYGMATWLLVAGLVSMAPPLWCAFHATDIKAEFSTEEEVVKSTGRVWTAAYAVITVVAVVAAGVVGISRYRASHAG
ncbi:MAG: hypothetical protein ABJA82_02260 [Myxococcales bacterium]